MNNTLILSRNTKLQKTKKQRSDRQVPKEQEEEPGELSTSNDEQREEAPENVSLLEELERVAALASSSSGANIISHDCCISSDVRELPEESVAEVEPEVEPLIETVPNAPSAPASTINVVPHVVQYPNLLPMHVSKTQVEEQSANIVYRQSETQASGFALARSNVKPLSDEQLRQIYTCPDLDLAKQFELEFLMNSLLESSEADPLYSALQEYYELQGKITSNLHDVKKWRKNCGVSQRQIWNRESVTRNFSGTCGDGNVVQESVTFE